MLSARIFGEFAGPCRNARRPNVIVAAAHGAPPETREMTMKYLLLIYVDEAQGRAIAANKDDSNKMMPAYTAYAGALHQAGVLVGGERLQFSDTATTVR